MDEVCVYQLPVGPSEHTTLAPPQSSSESYADVVITLADDMSEPYMLSGRRRDAGVLVLLEGKLEEKEDMVVELVCGSFGSDGDLGVGVFGWFEVAANVGFQRRERTTCTLRVEVHC